MSHWFWGQQKAKFHGLVNQGATCYLNSVLQVLFMTEDFKDRVKRHKRNNAEIEHIDSELTELFNDLQQNDAKTFKVTKKLKITNVHEQRDAAEHFEKILRLTSPEASQIFRGELINRNTCLKCQTQTESVAGFWHLPLALVDSHNHYSVVKGIEEFFRSSEITGDDQMYCERCDEKCDAVLDCEVKHHPEVLVLLLKRFDFDRHMRKVKINCFVEVPYILHIPQNQVYELYACVEHSGELRYGHYISRIKSQDNGRWYIFDDSRVTELRLIDRPRGQVNQAAESPQLPPDLREEVDRGGAPHCPHPLSPPPDPKKATVSTEMERSQTAYLLFYQKQKAVDPFPGDISEGSTPEAPEVEVTSGTEDTQSTTEEEEHNTSVRAASKRDISSVENNKEEACAEDIQIKKQKKESKEERGIRDGDESGQSSPKIEEKEMNEYNIPLGQSQDSNEIENTNDKSELRGNPAQSFETIKKDSDVQDNDCELHQHSCPRPNPDLSNVPKNRSVNTKDDEQVDRREKSSDFGASVEDRGRADSEGTVQRESMESHGLSDPTEEEHNYIKDKEQNKIISSSANYQESEQKEEGASWSNKEREQTERTGLLQEHKTKSNGLESLGVTIEGDTQIYKYMGKKQDTTHQSRGDSFTSGFHGNRSHDTRNSPEDLAQCFKSLTLSSSMEIKEDEREEGLRNKEDGQEQGLEERLLWKERCSDAQTGQTD